MSRPRNETRLISRFGRLFHDRYLFFIFGAVCSLLLMLIVLLYINFYKETRKASEAYAIEVANSYSIRIEYSFRSMEYVGKAVRTQVEPLLRARTTDTYEQFITMQKSLLVIYPNVHSIRVIFTEDPENHSFYLYRKDGYPTMRRDMDFLGSRSYAKEKGSISVHITEKFEDDGVGMVALIYPIIDAEHIQRGVIYINVEAAHFVRINSQYNPLGCETFIVDNSFNVLAEAYVGSTAPVRLNITRDSEWGKIIAQTIDKGKLVSAYVDNPVINEESLLVSYPLDTHDDTHGAFCTIVPKTVIYRGLKNTTRLMAGSFLVLVGFALLFALLGYKIRKKMYTDPLTGVLNRQYINRYLPIALEKSFLKKQPVAVAICDIDHFKRVNDKYGHHAGDLALKHFASILKANIRKTDWLARYGGEEFVLCLPTTGPANAILVIERIRQAAENAPCAISHDQSISITASFGIASTDIDTLTDMTAIMKIADSNLYKAKEGGRNRIAA